MGLGDFIDPLYIIPMVAVAIAIVLWKRDRKDHLPPGPRPFPVVGNLPHLKGDEMFYVKLNEIRRRHGDIAFLCLGAVKMLVLFGHRKVKAALGVESAEFKYRPQWLVEIKSLGLSKGIVWSNGAYNQSIRAFALPALYPGVGPMTVEERVQTEASIVMDAIVEHGGEPTQLFQIFYRAICNINCGVIFGSRYEYSDPEFLHFIELMDKLLQRQGVKNPLNFFPILQNLPEGKKVKEIKEVLEQIKSFIKTRLDKERETFDPHSTKSLLDLYILRSQNATSDDEITEESLYHVIRDLFVAGSENVAIGLQWLVAYMIRYPDVQDKCRTLLKQTIGYNEEVSMKDRDRLVFIEATVNEVLRLANIAPLSVPHATLQETTIEDGEYHIPKDTMVITHLESVHLDAEFWEEPETFDPTRFIGDDGRLLKKEAFYPFSTGPRRCLAENLAMMELFIIFSTLLQRVTFTSPEGAEPPSLRGIQPGAFVEPPSFCVCCEPVKR